MVVGRPSVVVSKISNWLLKIKFMGRTIGPKNKLARRFGISLGLKTNVAKVSRRLSQKPGVHGPNAKRASVSGYGKQLIEKQKAKIIYGLRERQFSRYVKEATRQVGDSGVNVLRMLETRLDNVVYRLGFADTRAQARQMVTHGMFNVNGRYLNIPSAVVKIGDVITIKENKKQKTLFANISEKLSKHTAPSWLFSDSALVSGKMLSLPLDTDFDKSFDVQLIIEFYSTR